MLYSKCKSSNFTEIPRTYVTLLYVDLGPDLTEMFTMWGTLSKLMDDDYISISTYILNGPTPLPSSISSFSVDEEIQ